MIFPDYIQDPKIARKYTWLLAIRTLLGEEITALEWQMAKNRDVSSYNDFAERVKKLEEYINSEIFTTQLDISSADKEAKAILDEGHKEFAIQHTELEEKCIKVLEDITKYLKKTNHEVTFDKKMDEYMSLIRARSFLSLITLDDILTTADQQMTWHIFCSWLYPEWELLPNSIATQPQENAEKIAKTLRGVLVYTTIQNIIPQKDLARIQKEIQIGLSRSHDFYPNT